MNELINRMCYNQQAHMRLLDHSGNPDIYFNDRNDIVKTDIRSYLDYFDHFKTSMLSAMFLDALYNKPLKNMAVLAVYTNGSGSCTVYSFVTDPENLGSDWVMYDFASMNKTNRRFTYYELDQIPCFARKPTGYQDIYEYGVLLSDEAAEVYMASGTYIQANDHMLWAMRELIKDEEDVYKIMLRCSLFDNVYSDTFDLKRKVVLEHVFPNGKQLKDIIDAGCIRIDSGYYAFPWNKSSELLGLDTEAFMHDTPMSGSAFRMLSKVIGYHTRQTQLKEVEL